MFHPKPNRRAPEGEPDHQQDDEDGKDAADQKRRWHGDRTLPGSAEYRWVGVVKLCAERLAIEALSLGGRGAELWVGGQAVAVLSILSRRPRGPSSSHASAGAGPSFSLLGEG